MITIEKFICIDWLQICFNGYQDKFSHSGWKLTDTQTKIFCEIWEFWNYDELILTAATKPKSKILKPDICIIKIDNKQLYTNTLFQLLNEVVKFEKLKFNNITRLDICMDFQLFDNKDKPQQVCERFFNNRYLKNGKSEFKCMGNQTNQINYNYLRFGKNTASVSAYMYNKTLEMNEVKLKSHILQLWENLGIANNTDVWRLEFSIKEFSNNLINNDTGEIVEINYSELSNQAKLFEIYKALYNKYFDFRKNDYSQNKSRMKRVMLFEFDKAVYRWFVDPKKLDSTRADRIFINKIEKYNNELRQINLDKFDELEEMKLKIIETKNLKNWYNKTHAETII